MVNILFSMSWGFAESVHEFFLFIHLFSRYPTIDIFHQAGNAIRTRDIHLGKVTLYH
jgi:hypothetical protein